MTCNKAQVNMSCHQLCYRILMFKTAVYTVFWLLVTEDKNYVLPKARIQILFCLTLNKAVHQVQVGFMT